MVSRVILISHAPTTAVRLGAFPRDEELEDNAIADTTRIGGDRRYHHDAFAGPEMRTLQTATALGLQAKVATELRDCDYGEWAGRSLSDIHAHDSVGLESWLSDPTFRPPGGESIAEIAKRTAAWLENQIKTEKSHRIVVVTHASIIRAAVLHGVGAPLDSFWRFDIAPLSETRLSHDGRRWRLQSMAKLAPQKADDD